MTNLASEINNNYTVFKYLTSWTNIQNFLFHSRTQKEGVTCAIKTSVYEHFEKVRVSFNIISTNTNTKYRSNIQSSGQTHKHRPRRETELAWHLHVGRQSIKCQYIRTSFLTRKV